MIISRFTNFNFFSTHILLEGNVTASICSFKMCFQDQNFAAKFSVAEAEDQTLTTFRPSVISYDNRKILNRLLLCYALSDIGCDRVAKLFVRQLPLYFSLWLEFPFPALRSLVYWRMKDTWTFASPMVNLREINKLIEYFYPVIGQLRLSEFHKFHKRLFE